MLDKNLLNRKSIILSTSYLAPIEYYIAIANAQNILIENFENYCKQSYRNRCRIATANGSMDLTIPIEKSSKEKVQIRDIRISEHSNWQLQHLRTIETAYNPSPFYEYFIDELIPFYEKKWNFLFDFNQEIQNKIFEFLDLNIEIILTKNYESNFETSYLDLRELIHPKKDNNFDLKPYYQVFEQKFGFIQNLSIIDLIFNMGNESQLILKN